MASRWHYKVCGVEIGPVAFVQLVEALRAGTLDETSPVRGAGQSDWQRAGDVVGLLRAAALANDQTHDRREPLPTSEEVAKPQLVRPSGHREPFRNSPPASTNPESANDKAGARRNGSTLANRFLSAKLTTRALIGTVLGIAVVAAITGGALYRHRESNRFPEPVARQSRAETGRYLFGWGPLGPYEYALVCLDGLVVVAGATLFGAKRLFRANEEREDRRHQ